MKHIVKLARKFALPAAAAVACVATARATGTADTDIVGGIDNSVATWTAVKTALIPIGVFMVCWGFFKKIRRA